VKFSRGFGHKQRCKDQFAVYEQQVNSQKRNPQLMRAQAQTWEKGWVMGYGSVWVMGYGHGLRKKKNKIKLEMI
jgi:hypothetical protein